MKIFPLVRDVAVLRLPIPCRGICVAYLDALLVPGGHAPGDAHRFAPELVAML